VDEVGLSFSDQIADSQDGAINVVGIRSIVFSGSLKEGDSMVDKHILGPGVSRDRHRVGHHRFEDPIAR
jgi:hypothetical protein